MPSKVVRINPVGLFGPGERSRAMIPATKPMIMIQRMLTATCCVCQATMKKHQESFRRNQCALLAGAAKPDSKQRGNRDDRQKAIEHDEQGRRQPFRVGLRW